MAIVHIDIVARGGARRCGTTAGLTLGSSSVSSGEAALRLAVVGSVTVTPTISTLSSHVE